MNSILMIIPVYNEEKNIGYVINDLQKNWNNKTDILFIDDGSIDKSLYFIKKANMKFLENGENKGYSYTIKKGLRYGYEHHYDYVITIDSDGQHNVLDALNIINAIDKKIDILIGSRYLEKIDMEKKLKKFGIKLSTKMVEIFFKQTITDMNCGMRCYNRKSMEYIIKEDDQYLDLNLIIKLIRSNFIIREIPINAKSRIYGTSMYNRKTEKIKYVYKICKYSVANLISKR